MPSKGPEETWGLAINEAMSCSRPVLVSDKVGCAKDLVIAEKTGWVFPSQNEELLVKTLTKIANLDKDILKEKGCNAFNYIQNWSFEKICNAVETTLINEP